MKDIQIDVRRHISIACYILVGFYIILAFYLLSGLSKPGLFYRTGVPAGADFLQIWAASSLASQGHPASVYKPLELKKVETGIIGGEFPGQEPTILPWHYTPSFLLLMLPVSGLNYLVSVALWLFIPLGVYLLVLYRIFPDRLTIWLALASMSVAYNLFYGQGAFLIGALLGGGLLLLDCSPLLAGIFFSVILSYKPHLGLLILVALFAGRNWRALGACAIATAALVLASAWVFGLDTWLAFWKDLHLMRMQLTDANLWDRMPTVFASLRLPGGGERLALTLQILVALGVLIGVYWVWQRQDSLPLRASVLVLGTLLVTPHAMDYDLALLLLPLAWTAWEVYSNHWGRRDSLILLFAWLIPFLNPISVHLGRINLTPIILVVWLIYLLTRASAGNGAKEPLPSG